MRTIARLGAGLASLSLVATGTALAVSPADAVDHDPIGLEQGATWLSGQVSNGFVPSSFGGPDYGLSIDTAFALRAAGGQDVTVTAIGDALKSRGTGYLEYAYSDDRTTLHRSVGQRHREGDGAAADARLRRTTIGSVDVQQRLESLTADGAPIAGSPHGPLHQERVAPPSGSRLRQLHRPGLRGVRPGRGRLLEGRRRPRLPAAAAVPRRRLPPVVHPLAHRFRAVVHRRLDRRRRHHRDRAAPAEPDLRRRRSTRPAPPRAPT